MGQRLVRVEGDVDVALNCFKNTQWLTGLSEHTPVTRLTLANLSPLERGYLIAYINVDTL